MTMAVFGNIVTGLLVVWREHVRHRPAFPTGSWTKRFPGSWSFP